ncbi:PREDICTED: methyltransferase-like protein 13 [Tarenaya hassleriana]|uniref:methyltransferase-like protein 13 n=1 Tax=Tarenaya hassleriana TaxID=28532 RepID=UPI00053C0B53|nr:PREDICTED: methyltransferase-like protein 13 [Tarenaya hassleriana]
MQNNSREGFRVYARTERRRIDDDNDEQMENKPGKRDSDPNPSSGPSSALAYLDPHYWDERFSSEEHYEWFKDYSHFRHLIQNNVKPSSSVLELGCGNSQLSEELYKDGIVDITCIDLSIVAVEKMQSRLLSKGFKEIKVLQANMLDLPFSDECFDVVIEKGTMDVLFVDAGDPWNPRQETMDKVMATLDNVHRVLKPDGIFISITFGQPHFRRPLFEAPKFTWSVEYNTFGDGFHYFFYILRKGKRSYDDKELDERSEKPSIRLFQDELEGEDFLFRTRINDDDDDESNGDS